MSEKYSISLADYTMEQVAALCGTKDCHLDILRKAFACDLIVRDMQLILLGEEAIKEQVSECVFALLEMIAHPIEINEQDVIYASKLAKQDKLKQLSLTYQKPIAKTVHGKLIYPKTIGQRYLYKCMATNDIGFASGVAGTGKTYLAVAYAANL